jgi:hypothetical protein
MLCSTVPAQERLVGGFVSLRNKPFQQLAVGRVLHIGRGNDPTKVSNDTA